MKTVMTAASMRDSESIRVVRIALDSDGLDQPGGRKSVSLAEDEEEAGVVARSSTGCIGVGLEAS